MENLKIIVTDKKDIEHEVEFDLKSSLGETLLYYPIGVDIQPFAICGFNCSCRTCHVLVDAEYLDKLPEMEEEEEYLLNTSLNREHNSRLACQIQMNETLNGMKVKIPEDS